MNKNQAQKELAFVKQVMEDSQRALLDNGKIFVILSLFALFGVCLKIFKDYMGLRIDNLYIYIPLVVIGLTFTIFYKTRVNRKTGGKTFASKAIDGLWTALLISASILSLIGYASGAIQPMAVAPVIAVLFGIHQYMSGLLLNLRWISSMAYGWWISSIGMFLWPGEHSVIVMGILLILFQLLPGIFLFQNRKKRRHA
jgi:hypothetical protein